MPTKDCTPCPTGSEGDGPIIVECNKYVRVSDILGIDSVLNPLENSLLFNGAGSKPVCMADGSKSNRIRLCRLQGSKGMAFFNLMGQDSSGYLHKILSDEDKGAQVLVGEAGSIGWKPKNEGNHCFPDGDIVEGSVDDPILAAFTACGPNGQTCLVKLPPDFISSQIPAAENFAADQHARDLCAGATSSNDLDTSELAARRNLSIICLEDGEMIVIDEPEDPTSGSDSAGLVSDQSFVQSASYGQLASWNIVEGGSGLITVAGGVITIKKAGVYSFNFGVGAYPTGSGGNMHVKPFVNGAENSSNSAVVFVAISSAAPWVSYPFVKTLAVNNTVEFKGKRDATGGFRDAKMSIVKVA